MSSVDFSSVLNVLGVTGSVNTDNVSRSDDTFSDYLKKITNKIDATENQRISDYKSKYIEKQPSRFEVEGLSQNSRYVQRESYNSRTKSSSELVNSSYSNSDRANDRKDISIIANAVGKSGNSADNVQSLINRDVRKVSQTVKEDNVKDVKVLGDKAILTPDNNTNMASKPNQYGSSNVLTDSTLGQSQPSNSNQDVAVDDNFLLASLVYKIFNVMNETGATDGTTMQGSSLKDFMDIIKQLPQEKLQELQTLIDPNNLDITAQDKANIEKIKDILLTTNYVVADNSEAKTEEITPAVKPDNYTKVDEEKIAKLAAQMLEENGLVTKKNVEGSSDDKHINTTNLNQDDVHYQEIASKVDVKSLKEIIEDIRKSKEEEELERLKGLLGTHENDNAEEEGSTPVERRADSETAKKYANITDELLNKVLTNLETAGKTLEELANSSLKAEVMKLISKGLNDDEVAEAIKPMIENDDKLFSQFVDKLAEKIELQNGSFVKVGADSNSINPSTQTADVKQQPNTADILKNLINPNSSDDVKNAHDKELEKNSKLNTKDSPQIVQNIVSKADNKQDVENKANLMKSYEELKVQLEKVVNASTQGESKGDFSQSKQDKNTTLFDAPKQNTQSQVNQLANSSSTTQIKPANATLDFNMQFRDFNDVKNDKSMPTQDIRQASYDVKDPKDISRLFKTLEQSLNKGESKVTVSLSPENLGKMEIRLVENAGKITAKFYTDSEASHKLIMSQADLFKNQLSEKGITIDNMEFNFNDPATKQGRDEERRTAKNNKGDDKKENIIERDKNINFRNKASRAGGLYA